MCTQLPQSLLARADNLTPLCLLQSSILQPMDTAFQASPVPSATSPLITSSVQESLFSLATGCVPNTSTEMSIDTLPVVTQEGPGQTSRALEAEYVQIHQSQPTIGQQFLSAIEQEKVNTGNSENIIEDENSLSADMVEVDNQDGKLDSEVVISRTNKESEAVDPVGRVSVLEFEIKKQCEKQSFENSLKEDSNHTILSAIKQEGTNFNNPIKPMKIDEHPFSVNTVQVDIQKETLTSKEVKKSGADIKLQISTDEFKSISRYKQGEDSKSQRRFKRTVTPQMLQDKFQRRQDRKKHIQGEKGRRDRGHWRCPFFKFGWNEGLRLPSIEDCPVCSERYQEYRSYKR